MAMTVLSVMFWVLFWILIGSALLFLLMVVFAVFVSVAESTGDGWRDLRMLPWRKRLGPLQRGLLNALAFLFWLVLMVKVVLTLLEGMR